MRYLIVGLAVVLTASSLFAQPAAKTNGLELPPAIEADANTKFVDVEAKTEGKVKWLVVWEKDILQAKERGNTITVAVPDDGAVIVFAVAVVKGELTDFVATRISRKPTGKPGNPGSPPTGPPIPSGAKLNVNLVFDFAAMTPDQAQIANSRELAEALEKAGHKLNRYDQTSAAVKSRKLDQAAAQAGIKAPYMIVLDQQTGAVRKAVALPKTPADVLNALR